MSICMYGGASDDVKPEYPQLAQRLGTQLAASGNRMVYGGGGVGQMGACATSAHAEGGTLPGVMPLTAGQRAHLRGCRACAGRRYAYPQDADARRG